MKRIPAIAVLLLCLVALFWRLDGVPLWRDEATTAVWGRLMAETGSGLPYAYDRRTGQLLVQDDDGHDINSQLLPAMQSHLQFFVSAAGHKLLGGGTLRARLPFALLALGSLILLAWLGHRLGGPSWLPLVLPLSACVSIYFLNAARQGRYYILVVFATILLLVHVARYLRSPALGKSWAFHLQLALIGCLLYGSNYLSFAATWLALGVFLLATDRPALIRLCGISALLAVVLGAEFWLLHAEYLTEWRPGGETASWENFRNVVSRRGGDFWRWVPFVFLIPVAVLLLFTGRSRFPAWQKPLGWLVAAIPFVGFVLPEPWLRRASDPTFVLFCLLFLAVPAGLFFLWTRVERPGVQARMAFLAALILTICPLFTICVAGRGALARYYYQCCPAAVVLIGLAGAGLQRCGRGRLAAVCVVGASLWPSLELTGGGAEQVVLRQFLRDDETNGRLLEFLAAHTRPGDSIAFFRNVKGMTAYYYLPDRRWVNQLDASIAYNQRFRSKVPKDQFDDAPDPDWFVLWDPRGKRPRMLDGRYEPVWEHTYRQARSLWDSGTPARERSYTVYRLP